MALFEENKSGQANNLKQAFKAWDAGVPANQVWERIEEDLILDYTWNKLNDSLSVEKVWHNLVDDLERNPNVSLKESFENWNTDSPVNGWSKLEEELSRERVWIRVKNSLNAPIAVNSPLWKMVAATLLFVSIAFYTDYNPKAIITFDKPLVGNVPGPQTNVVENGVVTNPNNFALEPREEKQLEYTPAENATAANQQYISKPTNEGVQQKTETQDLAYNDDNVDFELGKRELMATYKPLENFVSKTRIILRPKWSVGFGTQCAVINENKRSDLTSSLPRLGFAGDVQYHMYFHNLRWTNGLGMAQYKQANGKYLNGRYQTAFENLNTVYFASNLGYSIDRFTFYGGFMLNKLINGYEGTKNLTTNIYNSKQLQFGGSVGIDYNFTPFKNRTCLGMNVHYQFVPSLKSSNKIFEDIHGVGLQIKYSF